MSKRPAECQHSGALDADDLKASFGIIVALLQLAMAMPVMTRQTMGVTCT